MILQELVWKPMHPRSNLFYLKEFKKIRHLTGDFKTSCSHRHARMAYNVKQISFDYVHLAYKNRSVSTTWVCQPRSQKKYKVSAI